MPIATTFKGEGSTVHRFETNIADGSGTQPAMEQSLESGDDVHEHPLKGIRFAPMTARPLWCM